MNGSSCETRGEAFDGFERISLYWKWVLWSVAVVDEGIEGIERELFYLVFLRFDYPVGAVAGF
jgi:hypothetical protein